MESVRPRILECPMTLPARSKRLENPKNRVLEDAERAPKMKVKNMIISGGLVFYAIAGVVIGIAGFAPTNSPLLEAEKDALWIVWIPVIAALAVAVPTWETQSDFRGYLGSVLAHWFGLSLVAYLVAAVLVYFAGILSSGAIGARADVAWVIYIPYYYFTVGEDPSSSAGLVVIYLFAVLVVCAVAVARQNVSFARMEAGGSRYSQAPSQPQQMYLAGVTQEGKMPAGQVQPGDIIWVDFYEGGSHKAHVVSYPQDHIFLVRMITDQHVDVDYGEGGYILPPGNETGLVRRSRTKGVVQVITHSTVEWTGHWPVP